MGMLAAKLLEFDLPQSDKRLFAFAETDGCLLSGIGAATGCWVERRTLRVQDFGKVAVTFVDTQTGQAVRITPAPRARQMAKEYAPEATDRWHAMLQGYQQMPDELLLNSQPVELQVDLGAILSHEGHRVTCDSCGEDIINEREVMRGDRTLCLDCAGHSYYHHAMSPVSGFALPLELTR